MKELASGVEMIVTFSLVYCALICFVLETRCAGVASKIVSESSREDDDEVEEAELSLLEAFPSFGSTSELDTLITFDGGVNLEADADLL